MMQQLSPVLIMHTSEVEPMPFMNNLIKRMTSIIFVACKTININKVEKPEMQSLITRN